MVRPEADRGRPRRRGRQSAPTSTSGRRADRLYGQDAQPGRRWPGAAKPGADLLGQNSSPAKPRPAPQKPGGSVDPLGAGGQSSKISRVDAQGHVVVSNATDIGRGDYGVYNADTGIVTLLGNVTITRGQDVDPGPVCRHRPQQQCQPDHDRRRQAGGAGASGSQGLLRAPGRRRCARQPGGRGQIAAARSRLANLRPLRVACRHERD